MKADRLPDQSQRKFSDASTTDGLSRWRFCTPRQDTVQSAQVALLAYRLNMALVGFCIKAEPNAPAQGQQVTRSLDLLSTLLAEAEGGRSAQAARDPTSFQ